MKPRYIVAITALIGALGIGIAALVVRTSAQANLHHAALIVQMKDGGIATRCVAFSESEITGYDLLRRAQMPVIADVSNGGISVCKIGPSSGCNYPAQKCFCDCQDLGGTCIYWMYYYQDQGQWKYASLGAGAQKVKDRDVNGWVYSAGTTAGGTFPPVISFEQICDAAAPPATPDAHPVTPTIASVSEPTVESVVITPTHVAQVTATTAISTPTASAMLSNTATPPPHASATATLTPIASLTPTSIATLAPPSATPALPTPTPAPVATAEQSAPNTVGYVVFGVIAVGLTAALLITRRNAGKVDR